MSVFFNILVKEGYYLSFFSRKSLMVGPLYEKGLL